MICKLQKLFLFLVLLTNISCNDANGQEDIENTPPNGGFADVIEVTVSGTENNYTFSVTISSPDTGCDQYADWWEVVSASGDLLYRRILLHSHVNEQPFSRSGGVVPITSDQVAWIRAHMNNEGYGGKVMKGTVLGGFEEEIQPEGFALGLDQESPLPLGCAF